MRKMKKAKAKRVINHLDNGNGAPICGQAGKKMNIFKNVDAVTCKRCLATMNREATETATETVHMAKVDGGALCGQVGNVTVNTDETKVTCKRCLKMIEKAIAEAVDSEKVAEAA